MKQTVFFAIGIAALLSGAAMPGEQVPIRHVQLPMHRLMVARLESGRVVANGDFSQVVQGDEVTMRLVYKFADGSLDDEMTTYRQGGTFHLVRTHLVQKGPFFEKQVDFAVDVATGIATTRTTGRNGKVHVENQHIDLPDDLANGFIGTLLLNVPQNAAPLRVGMLAPVRGGRLIRLLISQDGSQAFRMAGQPVRATVFRIHPELGGIVGAIAPLIGLQPKDVMVWVMEGEVPAVVRIVGQLGGYGPVISAELEGSSFGK